MKEFRDKKLKNYKDYEIEATCEKFMTRTYDVLLEADIMEGEYRAVLSWNRFEGDLDISFSGGGTYTRAYEYGPESVIFTVDPTKTYALWVNGYDFWGPDPLEHVMTNSNPVVTLYKDSTIVATFKMPYEAGCRWHVFDIKNGLLSKNGWIGFYS